MAYCRGRVSTAPLSAACNLSVISLSCASFSADGPLAVSKRNPNPDLRIGVVNLDNLHLQQNLRREARLTAHLLQLVLHAATCFFGFHLLDNFGGFATRGGSAESSPGAIEPVARASKPMVPRIRRMSCSFTKAVGHEKSRPSCQLPRPGSGKYQSAEGASITAWRSVLNLPAAARLVSGTQTGPSSAAGAGFSARWRPRGDFVPCGHRSRRAGCNGRQPRIEGFGNPGWLARLSR